jgi:DNA-binding NarL/FixJ family response regulator
MRRSSPRSRRSSKRRSPLTKREFDRVAQALELSPQQARIVSLLMEGMTDKEIAAEMDLKFSTVRTYMDRIFLRLGVDDRVELVLHVFGVHSGRASGRASGQDC